MVPIEVTNTRGFTLPQTGDYGTLGFTIVGILTMAGAAVVLVLATRKKRGVR
ncbi:MAG: LPXTG cell wall anchor domain-containing protein [Oscillospiraceae bacterium]|nr:LPXTG cell wall anchor domain-containing protein [Oscillospiraceae bacterium]